MSAWQWTCRRKASSCCTASARPTAAVRPVDSYAAPTMAANTALLNHNVKLGHYGLGMCVQTVLSQRLTTSDRLTGRPFSIGCRSGFCYSSGHL